MPTPSAVRNEIWLLQEAEPLPCDPDAKLLRTGLLAQQLVRDHHHVRWFTGRFAHHLKRARTTTSPFAFGDRITIELLPGPGYHANHSAMRVIHQHCTAVAFYRRAQLLTRPALIVASYPSPELAACGALLADRWRVPFILDIRDPWPEIFSSYLGPWLRTVAAPLFSYYTRLLRYSLNRADVVLSVSQAMQEWARPLRSAETSCHWEVLMLSAEGYGLKSPPQRDWRFSRENPFTLLFIGSFGSTHDVPSIVAAARLLASQPLHLRFLIVGDGEYAEAWRTQASDLKQLEFPGWLSREQLCQLATRSHFGLLCIRGAQVDFGIPNKLFEYLSAGLPLLSTLRGFAQALIEREQLGTSIPAENPSALADAIKRAYEQPSRLEAQALSNYRYFNDQLSSAHTYQRYANILYRSAPALSHSETDALSTCEGT